MANSLQHKYWATVENPRLAQRRRPEPIEAAEPSRVPDGARILRPLGDEFVSAGEALATGVALDHVMTPTTAARVKASLPPGVVYSTATPPRHHAAHDAVPDNLDEEGCLLPAPILGRTDDEPVRKLREGHREPKPRSKWKRVPGTYKRFTTVGEIR